MSETVTELGVWFAPSARSKLAAQKARRYFKVRDKHVFYGHTAWQEHIVPPFMTGAQPKIVFAHGDARQHLYGNTRLVWTGTKSPRVTSYEYVKTVSKLIEVLELPGGWNSYNAKPISKENVTFAVALLGRLMRANTPAPLVIPKVRGGVQLEWHTRGIDIEVAIESPDRITFFAEDRRSTQAPAEEGTDERVLKQWIDRLSG